MGDPSSNMDELLKAYARKRREQGGEPPPLHSATRHQLQEEVRRTYAARQSAPRPWFLTLYGFFARPARAGAVALAAVTVGLFVALWPQTQLPSVPSPSVGSRTVEKAKDDVALTSPSPALARSTAERESLDLKSPSGYGVASAGEPTRPSAPAEGPLTRTEPTIAEAPGRGGRLSRFHDRDAFAPSSSTAAPVTSAPRVAAKEGFASDATSNLPSVESAAKPTPAASAKPAATEALARGGPLAPPSAPLPSSAAPRTAGAKEGAAPADPLMAELRDHQPGDPSFVARRGMDMAGGKEELFFAAGDTTVQNAHFLSRSSQRADHAAGHAILLSFRMSRVGNEVVLVDGDGSVYRGTVETTGPAEADKLAESKARLKQDRAALKAEAGARATRGSQAGTQGFSFRVSGTNLTLRQGIEITANYTLEGAEVTKSQTASGSVALSNQALNYFDYQDNRARAQQLQNAPVPKGRIQGRARLADKSEVDLDAVTTPAP